MSGTYRTTRAFESYATAVDTGDKRRFLVIQFRISGEGWKTLVLERGASPDCWLSRRELGAYMESESAVTGLLLGSTALPHPVEELKKRLSIEQRQNFILRGEIRRLTLRAEKAGRKRGARGRGNS